MSKMSCVCPIEISPTALLAASPPINSSIQMVLLAGGIVVLCLVLGRHKWKSRSATAPRTSAQRGACSTAADRSVRELGEVMAELDHLSREIHAKIDLKLATIQKLIRDADQRIDLLSRLERSAAGQPSLDVQLKSEAPDQITEDDGPHDAIYRLADSGYSSLQIARELARHTGEVELILSLRRATTKSARREPSVRKQAG